MGSRASLDPSYCARMVDVKGLNQTAYARLTGMALLWRYPGMTKCI